MAQAIKASCDRGKGVTGIGFAAGTKRIVLIVEDEYLAVRISIDGVFSGYSYDATDLVKLLCRVLEAE
jgi:hypothetical protein